MKHKTTALEQAKKLRKDMTKQEHKLWYFLRNSSFYNFKFRRQVPIGKYVADFVCIAKKLIIELDGSQHFESAVYDNERTDFLNSKGYKVIRFWNTDIDNNINGVLENIAREMGIKD